MTITTDTVLAYAQHRLDGATNAECRAMLAEIIAATWCTHEHHLPPLVHMSAADFLDAVGSVLGDGLAGLPEQSEIEAQLVDLECDTCFACFDRAERQIGERCGLNADSPGAPECSGHVAVPAEPAGEQITVDEPVDITRALRIAALNHPGARAVLDAIGRGASPDLMVGELLNTLFGTIAGIRKRLDQHGAEWLASLGETSAKRSAS